MQIISVIPYLYKHRPRCVGFDSLQQRQQTALSTNIENSTHFPQKESNPLCGHGQLADVHKGGHTKVKNMWANSMSYQHKIIILKVKTIKIYHFFP